ncbi:hypothetical protein A6A03_13755 [Chloroflexus islandicus]|uniref:Type II secretion system protein GspF domain-containing protein n=1 Tax=Chloroflexus islandicus TaxID=1707952 RepID=A0A178MB63_9CHLR|nr:type II secretion system F family protein [Chloroflexus islandicus]OAN45803.1 hypothetical protein A6A03_13755 [Chloroflexus islandicus]
MSLTILITMSTLAGVSVWLMVLGLTQVRRHADIRRRLDTFLVNGEEHPVVVREQELARPFSQRVIVPIAATIARLALWFWPQHWLDTLHQRLLQAGNPGGMGANEFAGLKLLMALIAAGAVGAGWIGLQPPLTFNTVAIALLLVAVAFVIPDFWLGRRIKQRRQQIINALPDVLDLMVVTTEAGLSFESGMQEIVTKWSHPLAREFSRTLRDLAMGSSRREALNALAQRTQVEDVRSFVVAINQAEELGVSIGRVLRTQADDMRVRRRQRAYEQANKAPVKMMFPLVFLIFPAIFAVLLGPAVVRFAELGL